MPDRSPLARLGRAVDDALAIGSTLFAFVTLGYFAVRLLGPGV